MRADNVEELRLAMAEFERAFGIDPEYVHAYYKWAQTILTYPGNKGPEQEERDRLKARSDEVLQIAQELDSRYAPAI